MMVVSLNWRPIEMTQGLSFALGHPRLVREAILNADTPSNSDPAFAGVTGNQSSLEANGSPIKSGMTAEGTSPLMVLGWW